jgi:hypothetical protein
MHSALHFLPVTCIQRFTSYLQHAFSASLPTSNMHSALHFLPATCIQCDDFALIEFFKCKQHRGDFTCWHLDFYSLVIGGIRHSLHLLSVFVYHLTCVAHNSSSSRWRTARIPIALPTILCWFSAAVHECRALQTPHHGRHCHESWGPGRTSPGRVDRPQLPGWHRGSEDVENDVKWVVPSTQSWTASPPM